MSEKDPYAAKKKMENPENQSKQDDASTQQRNENQDMGQDTSASRSSGSISQGSQGTQKQNWDSNNQSGNQQSRPGSQNVQGSTKTTRETEIQDDEDDEK
jgi:hypothetical protein